MNVAVGILIGGKSRRMGTPKALIQVGDLTLLERTVEIARVVSDDVLLLGRARFEMPASLKSLVILPDQHPGVGPLAGLESLLLARPLAACILLACDMPYLSADVLKRLIEAVKDRDAAVCTTPTDPPWHPCCALYQPHCLTEVQAAIGARRYGMMDMLGRLHVRRVDLMGEEAHWVENWNEPGDVRPLQE